MRPVLNLNVEPTLKPPSLAFLVPQAFPSPVRPCASPSKATMSLCILNKEGYGTLNSSIWCPSRKLIRKIAFEFKANWGSVPSEFKFNLGFIGISKNTQERFWGTKGSKPTLSVGLELTLCLMVSQ